MATVTLQLPELLYRRLEGAAQATQRSIEEVMVRALRLGSPPSWDDAPEEFQLDLAALDRLDDDALWMIAGSRKDSAEVARYDELLACQSQGNLTAEQRAELTKLRNEQDAFMLRKAHAAALLRWRGHQVPGL